MFQHFFRKAGSIPSMLRIPEKSLLSRTLCGMAGRSNLGTKRKEVCATDRYGQTRSRSMCSMSPLGNGVMQTNEWNSILKSGDSDKMLQSTMTAPLNNLTFVRTHLRRNYRPSAIKRMRKHGLEKRISSRSQREILFRRILAGRGMLTTFDRFMNEVPEVRKKKSKRVDLFDTKKGFKSVVKKKTDKFIFKEI